MKLAFPLALGIILFSSTVSAQNEKVIVKFCPPALIDIVGFPTFQVGVEQRLSRHFSFYNEAGIELYHFSKSDTNFIGSSGFKLKTELRYYFKKKHSRRNFYKTPAAYTMNGQYAAVNAFYVHNNFNKQISYFPDGGPDMKEDAMGIRKTVWGLNLLVGIQQHWGRKFVLDAYTGLGVRYRYITDINRQFIPDKDRVSTSIDPSIHEWLDGVDARGGYSMAPNFSLGFRIGYRL